MVIWRWLIQVICVIVIVVSLIVLLTDVRSGSDSWCYALVVGIVGLLASLLITEGIDE